MGTGAAEGTAICGMNAVPFSEATMFAIVKEAAAAAALLDTGAVAAAAKASVAASSSGNPIAGVLYVLIGSRSGRAIPLLPLVFLFLRLFMSLSRSFSFLSISPSLRKLRSGVKA